MLCFDPNKAFHHEFILVLRRGIICRKFCCFCLCFCIRHNQQKRTVKVCMIQIGSKNPLQNCGWFGRFGLFPCRKCCANVEDLQDQGWLLLRWCWFKEHHLQQVRKCGLEGSKLEAGLFLRSFYYNTKAHLGDNLDLFWVVVSMFFYFHPYLGKFSNLTHIFQMGWFNHQLVLLLRAGPAWFFLLGGEGLLIGGVQGHLGHT